MKIKKATRKFLQKARPIQKAKTFNKKSIFGDKSEKKRKFLDDDEAALEFDDLVGAENSEEEYEEIDDEELEGDDSNEESEEGEFFSDAEDESDAEDSDHERESVVKASKPLDKKLFESWKGQKNEVLIKNLIFAFDSIARQYEEDTQVQYNVEEAVKPEVFHLLFEKCSVLNEIFGGKSPMNSPLWKEWKTPVRILFQAILDFLKQSSDDDTKTLLISILHSLKKFMNCFPKMIKKLVECLLGIWVSHVEASSQCVVLLHKFVSENSKTIGQMVLKGAFTEFAKSCKNITVFNQGKIQFLINGLVELFGAGKDTSYEILFKVIRQFAVHLRNSMTQKTKEHMKKILCWQFICCNRFIGQYLGHSKDKSSALLVYPFTQVVLGALQFQENSAKYHPFHFHLISILNAVMNSTGVFIPLYNHLLSIIKSTEAKKNPKVISLKPIMFSSNFKVTSNYLGTRIYNDCVHEEALYLMTEYFGCICGSISFPDLIVSPVAALKGILKETKNPKLKKLATQLVDKLIENAKFISTRRQSLSLSPNQTEKCEEFSKEAKLASPFLKYLNSCRNVRRMTEEAISKNTDYESKKISKDQTSMKEMAKKKQLEKPAKEKLVVKKDAPVKKGKKQRFEEKSSPNDEDVVEDFILSDEEEN